MSLNEENEQTLLEKLRELPPERLAEVEDFIDFLRQRAHDRQTSADFTRRSEEALRKVWDNAEDAAYDKL